VDELSFFTLKSRLESSTANSAAPPPLQCRIQSDSMSPLLQVNEVLTIQRISDPQQLRRFDLLVFYSEKKLTCHFLWTKPHWPKNSIITRSLKNYTQNDLPIPSSHLLGIIPDKRLSFFQKIKILVINIIFGSA